ncbi:hypothetical protein N657DRAFT_572778 [Parathielavia appendiculata]|uniref:Peroxisomal membrane protein PEX17 n=1 Tax=Parathielavia appendiculata TaxID=2587402 RepID=A0AAN6Z372_9PEZI|nr:hypothetical protein N657DRAFT_572778 [Parathielavia appendiculata]
MSIDRLLTTVLQLYQDVHDDARTEQLFGSTAALLTNLSNPLNVSLLTSQLLIAPAIWGRRDGMRTCYRIISIFNTAAIHVRRNEIENVKNKASSHQRIGGGLGSDAWATAVLKGADDYSGRWQHLLVFSGVLMGMEAGHRRSLSTSMRKTVERAVVTAANLALQSRDLAPPAPAGPVALALNYAFPLLSKSSHAGLDCDALVPVAIRAMLGGDGLQDGLFLATIDQDVRQSEHKFMWAENAPSYLHLRQLEQRPLMYGLGPLSRLLAHAVQNARDFRAVLQLQDDLVAFTARLLQHWRANKLSELDSSEEDLFLTPDTLTTTWPALWNFLKKVMYAVVAVLHAVVARSLLDRQLRNHTTASVVATKTLHTLRNLYFISSRNGNDAFQVYAFTYLTSLDTLSRYGPASAAFLHSIKPPCPSVSIHPLDRTLDLFYLNTAEHLPLNLSAADCDALIIQHATPYLSPDLPSSPSPSSSTLSIPSPSPIVRHLLEAAHSAILSVLSCPPQHNTNHRHPSFTTTASDIVPFYADTLLASFPARISPRQFRLAFKTIVKIVSQPPPSPYYGYEPAAAAGYGFGFELGEVLMEMVRGRVPLAGTDLLPQPLEEVGSGGTRGGEQQELVCSEQSVLVLALIDALPVVEAGVFEEWLGLVAEAVNLVRGERLRDGVRRRFWEVLVSGEMDVERAAVAVAWWGTKGGREMVLFGRGPVVTIPPPPPPPPPAQGEEYMMSGALVQGRGESKL